MVTIEQIILRAKKYNKNLNEEKVLMAFDLAAKAHKDQRRRSGEKYIIHPLEVSYYLTEYHAGEDEIIAGLLHDVVEDTKYTIKDIRKMFGDNIAYLVDGVSKLKRIPKETTIEIQTLRKMFLMMANDLRVVVIKLMDRLHNMKTLEYTSADKQIKKARQTFDVYIAIAERLNLWKIKKELENLSFKYLWPRDYERILSQFSQKNPYFNKTLLSINSKFEKTIQMKMKSKFRIKMEQYSLYEMYKKQNEFDDLDLKNCYFLNIITKDKQSCYEILGIIHENFRPRHNELRDYLACPKDNGYQAIHTTVFTSAGLVDLHIHTEQTFHSSEYSDIFMWYGNPEKKVEKSYSWIPKLLKICGELKNETDFNYSLKSEILRHIKVYSNTGKEYEVPSQATVLDFIVLDNPGGILQFSKIKINGKISKEIDVLFDKDIIEVEYIVGRSRVVRYEWINQVKTHQAKIKLEELIGGKNNLKALQEGLNIIKKWQDVILFEDLSKIRDKYEDHLIATTKFDSFESSLIALGKNKISIADYFDNVLPIKRVKGLNMVAPGIYEIVMVLEIEGREKYKDIEKVLNLLLTMGKKRGLKHFLFQQSIRISNKKIIIKYFIFNFKDLILLIEKMRHDINDFNSVKIYPFSNF